MSSVVEPDTEDLTGMFVVDAPPEPATNEDPEAVAARAVYAALLADTGRPKGLSRWKEVTKRSLGLKALWDRRWVKVLGFGVSLGLFEVDSTRKYDVLKVTPQPDPVEDPEVDLDDGEDPLPPEKTYDPAYVPQPPPEDWDHLDYLPCGHWNYQDVPAVLEPEAAAVAAEVAQVDHKAKPRMVSVKIETPDDCIACANGVAGHPQYQEEGYKTPVAKSRQRSFEKEGRGGFPGYCVNAEGYYIGGLANDCRHAGDERCEVHKPVIRVKKGKKGDT